MKKLRRLRTAWRLINLEAKKQRKFNGMDFVESYRYVAKILILKAKVRRGHFGKR